MGLEALELVIAVEDRFAITIEDAEAIRVRTVADLESLIRQKLAPQRSRAFLSAFTFYRLRTALRERVGALRAQVTPRASLGDLLPPKRRREAWAALSGALAWRLPDLCRNRLLEGGLLLGFLGAILVAVIGGALGLVPKAIAWSVGVGALPALWLAYRVTTPLAVHLPAKCATVGQAVDAILVLNFGRIADERRSWSENELWKALQATIVDKLGVDGERVTRDARFVDDLGVS